jgi:excisionase family DNA binding protein
MGLELKTVEEVAAVLRLKPTTIYRLARQGKIPSFKLSRKTIRFDLDAVLEAVGIRKPQPEAAGQEGSR